MQRSPDLLADGASEHVQDLVPVVARVAQPHCGVPHLWWRVVPQLGGDDLVHREVQTRVHRPIATLDLAAAFFQRLLELGMLAADHDRPHVRIGELLDLQIQRGKRIRIGDEAPSIVLITSMRSM